MKLGLLIVALLAFSACSSKDKQDKTAWNEPEGAWSADSQAASSDDSVNVSDDGSSVSDPSMGDTTTSEDEMNASATGATTTPAATGATATTTTATPKEVCQNIAQAAAKGDMEAAKQWTAGGMGKMGKKADKKKWDKMQSNYMDRLKDITCNAENIADDHAFVEAETKGQKRLIPMVKTADGWKFDAKTYHVFYEGDMPHGKGKSRDM